ncbi:pentatricopeptide repeat-containing protein At1g11290, chloroplastic-like isoform X2 [Selaginella moellendorffii]|uniref:pentatricopeptide repeat-containing protein At1g11290, chloroplastic-like isoform X2 n=1 Tax=Selaginella moellendorffii TaxID=88036 RepID=UPI000D1C963F|nr:pentatricopeptide repeat-containing protein At1g11290, chloroplastic-like isoform X2 [Selaginella moellendorffii]|eukprot:XP_024518895.1 pentatricopeptide repeat-containing protein At1g11290, chloroplastic-like isoform X2 [Selaginella moellendorffii]
MYMKCGSVVEAQQAFDRIPRPDAVCWNALISGYAENGEAEVALQLFRSMQQCCGASPRTFAAALAACSTLAAAEEGRKVDGRMVKVFSLQRGMGVHRQAEAGMGIDAIHRNVYVGNALIDMYVKCRSMVRAQEVFDRMKTRDVVSWNVLMLGYAQGGENEELALEMFTKMVSSRGCQLDSWSVVAALKACSNLAAKEEARNPQEKLRFLVTGVAIHGTAERLGCDSNIFVANALLNMYANCASMVDARRVFDKMQRRDVVSWNTIILGYAENDEGKMALQLFGDLLHSRCCVQDRLTLVAALKASCTLSTQEQGRQVDGTIVKLSSLEAGMAVHSLVSERGFDLEDLYVANCLVDMYGKCGSMADSRRVFDRVKHRDVVIWNAVISGYAQNDESEAALELFEALLCEGVSPTSLTVVAAFKACGSLAAQNKESDRMRALEITMAVHREAVTKLEASEWDAYMTSSLIDAYAKCGSLADSSKVFSSNTGQLRNVVSWNVLILGFAENGDARRALRLFHRMRREGCRPNASTYVAVLKACSNSIPSSLDLGSEVKALIYRGGFENDGVLAGSLVDFHGKAGDMVSARQVFDSLAGDGDEAWSALIAGYSRQGDASQALTLFHEMVNAGIKPNGITALAVLTSCSHAGFVEAGKKFFHEMPSRYGIVPEVEHFHCVVDLLSRANQREETLALVQETRGVESRSGDAMLVAKQEWPL